MGERWASAVQRTRVAEALVGAWCPLAVVWTRLGLVSWVYGPVWWSGLPDGWWCGSFHAHVNPLIRAWAHLPINGIVG